MKLTGGEGADVAVETVGGNEQLIEQTMAMSRRGGSVSVMGIFTKPQTINTDLAMQRELTLRWSNSLSRWHSVSEYATAVGLLADRRVTPGPIITHRFPLAKIGEAFASADDKRSSGAIRIVLNT